MPVASRLRSSVSGRRACCLENASSRCTRSAALCAAAHGGFDDHARLALDLFQHQAEAADHDGQKIVEIMRDAAGELTDRRHLLRLLQLHPVSCWTVMSRAPPR